MESLLPSEIARLVYGYLIEEKCEAAAQLFLETSEFLKECNVALKRGRKFNTRVMGLCLVDILNLYTDAVCMLKNFYQKEDPSLEDFSCVLNELQNILLIDEHNERNASKTLFLRISIPPKRKGSCSPEKKEAQEKEEAERRAKEEEEKKKKAEEEKKKALLESVVPAPLPSTSPGKSPVPQMDEFDLNMLQTLLDNTTLHERIAENINKAMDSSSEVTDPKSEEKKIVETVLHSTEADPIFDELIHMLAVPRQEDTTTPEDTDKENGDPTEKNLVPCPTSSSQEQETMRRLEVESNLAIEGILAGNKKTQETVIPTSQPSRLVPTDNSQVPTVSGVNILPSSPSGANAIVTPFTSSTPLQPLKSSNIPFAGFLSPVQSSSRPITRVLTKVASVSRRGSITRRRNILPKPEGMSSQIPQVIHVQVPNQDSTGSEIYEVIPVENVPEPLKVSTVRTRGGIRRTGSRGVKSITPQVSKIKDDKINVVFVEKTGVRTRPPVRRKRASSRSTKSVKPEGNLQAIEEATSLTEEQTSSREATIESVQQDENQETQAATEKLVELQDAPASETPIVVQEESPNNSNDIQTSSLPLPLISLHSPAGDSYQPPNKEEESLDKNTLCSDNNDKSSENKAHDKTNEGSLGNIDKEKEVVDDGTPEQHSAVASFKPRVSLSTPRRGSHVRVLDFKTPDKNRMEFRKSLTSPKMYPKSKLLEKVDNVRRGIFNSPDSNICKGPAKKSNWDADLRLFLSSENLDIPTSVGLKRKEVPKKEVKGRRKGGKPIKKNDSNKSIRTPSKHLSSSNEELDKETEKDALEVIDEENLPDKNDNSKCRSTEDMEIDNKDCSASSLEEVDKGENPCDGGKTPAVSMTDSVKISTEISNHISPSKNMEMEKDPITSKDVTSPQNESLPNDKMAISSSQCPENCHKNVLDANNEKVLPSFLISENSASNKENPDVFAATPLKLSMSPRSDSNLGQITPTTKILMSQLGAPSSSSLFSPQPNSYYNLESILITEGTRLEMEKANQWDSTKNLNILDKQPNIDVKSKLDDKTDKSDVGLTKKPLPSEKPNIMQTPAKPFIASVPPGMPVEMTPCTKVLHNETRILATALVTPTLPATPKVRDERSPDKTDSLVENTSIDREEKGATEMPTPQLTSLKDIELSAPEREETNAELSNLNVRDKTVDDSCNLENGTPQEEIINKPNISPQNSSKLKSNVLKASKTPKIKLLPKKSAIKDYLTPKPNKESLKPIKLSQPISSNLPNMNPVIGNKDVNINEKRTPIKSLSKGPLCFKTSDTPATPAAKKPRLIKSSTPKTKKVLSKPQPEQSPTSKVKKGKESNPQKVSPNKKSSKFQLELLKAEEIVLNECLQSAKAKLFGIESSSSDSSDDESSSLKKNISDASNKSKPSTSNTSIKEQESVHSRLLTARERLQNLESLSMLESSSSSDSIDFKTTSKQIAASSVKTNTVSDSLKRNDTPASPTKVNQTKNVIPPTKMNFSSISEVKKISSPNKSERVFGVNDNSKLSLREREESCESFPTLYLSEESNTSMISESHTLKSMKLRKSPSVGSDLFPRKLVNPMAPGTSSNTTEKNTPFYTKDNINLESKFGETLSIADHNKNRYNPIIKKVHKGPDYHESVIHQTPSMIPILSERERQLATEYLNDYTFSFTLDAEGREGIISKTLHTSPFFSIFELNSKHHFRSDNKNRSEKLPTTSPPPRSPQRVRSPPPRSPQRVRSPPPRSPRVRSPPPKSPQRARSPPRERSPQRDRSPMRDRSRKRRRSESSSDEEKRKSSRFHGGSHRDFRDTRPKPVPRRRKYSPQKSKFYPSPRYRNYHARPPYEKKRIRNDFREIPPRNRSGEREEKRPHKRNSNEHAETSSLPSKSFHTSHHRFEKRFKFNDSLRSSKSSESDRLHVDNSFRSSEHSASPRESSAELLNKSVTERIQIKFVKTKQDVVHVQKKEDREDGELSDSSEVPQIKSSTQLATGEAKRKDSLNLDQSRSKTLLSTVDLEEFLTLVHGEEK